MHSVGGHIGALPVNDTSILNYILWVSIYPVRTICSYTHSKLVVTVGVGTEDYCQCQKVFVTIRGGGLRERWELWYCEFNHGLSPVLRDGICYHHLFYFSAYLPIYDIRLAAQKRGQRGHFN